MNIVYRRKAENLILTIRKQHSAKALKDKALAECPDLSGLTAESFIQRNWSFLWM
jgi:hypothetical protein